MGNNHIPPFIYISLSNPFWSKFCMHCLPISQSKNYHKICWKGTEWSQRKGRCDPTAVAQPGQYSPDPTKPLITVHWKSVTMFPLTIINWKSKYCFSLPQLTSHFRFELAPFCLWVQLNEIGRITQSSMPPSDGGRQKIFVGEICGGTEFHKWVQSTLCLHLYLLSMRSDGRDR